MALGDKGATLDGLKASHDYLKNSISKETSARAPMVSLTESGDVVTITDGANENPVRSLVASIEPVQSGTGNPSPDNVRPITGWTGANVTRTGKNLLDASTCIIRNYINSRGKIETTPGWSASDYIPVKSGETYTLSNYNPSGNVARHAFYGIDKSFLSSIPAAGNNTFTVPSGAYYVRVTIKTENPTGAQLELGDTATDYEPYQGDTYAVTFPTEAGTVYGGTLDVTTGVLTVDRAAVDASTLSPWRYISDSEQVTGFYTHLRTIKTGLNPLLNSAPLICEKYATGGIGWTRIPSNYIGVNENASESSTQIIIKDPLYNDVNDFVDSLQGVKIVYELATPTTYQLTPTEVKTLLGANNIFADTGAVDVEYCADTKKYIDNAIATAIAAL